MYLQNNAEMEKYFYSNSNSIKDKNKNKKHVNKTKF